MHQCKRRHAQTVLLSFVMGFIAIQTGLTLVMELGGFALIDQEFQRHLCQAGMLRQGAAQKPFLLAVGSSRLQLAFDPGEIAGLEYGSSVVVYNNALEGFGLPQVLISLRRYLERGLRPDALLVEINPGCVAADPQVISPSQLERMTIQEILALAPYSPGQHWTLQTLVEERCIPCDGLRKKILLQILPSWLPHRTVAREKPAMRPQGGTKVDLPWLTEATRAARTAHARTEYAHALQHFRIAASADELLREILTLCRKEQIPVALLLMPEGDVFRSWYRPGGREELLRWINETAKSYQAEVIDAWTWCTEEDFFDSHHVLAKSVPRFTRKLWIEKILPWLSKQSAGNAGNLTQGRVCPLVQIVADRVFRRYGPRASAEHGLPVGAHQSLDDYSLQRAERNG